MRKFNFKLSVLFLSIVLILCTQTLYLRKKLNFLYQQIISIPASQSPGDIGHFKYRSQNNLKKLPIVAHAGGSYLGKTYTNSLEALEENKTAYKYFEIDFSKTADGHYVCSHGWTPYERSLALGENLEGPPTLSHFLEKRKSHSWNACTAEEAINWAYSNKKKIVTDIKESNIAALTYLINKFPLSRQVFIPQIYSIEEYHPVQQLGFDKIILTLYKSNISEQGLVNWLSQNEVSKLYAITTWHHRAPYLTKVMNDIKIPVYIHTVNDINIANFLIQHYGVQGIYTDDIKSYDK